MKKSILISGGTKGIGLAVARVFAEREFDVYVCARTKTDLDAMGDLWATEYPRSRLFTHPCDVGKKSELLEFAEWTKGNLRSLDVLVNNAGIFLPGKITEESDGALETLMEINLFSAYHLTRALLPLMTQHRSGHIFNMCSVASFMAYPNGGSYSISKFALLGFSKVLREELKPLGIKVSAIMPGATWSDSWAGFQAEESRLMQASDVARSIWAAYELSPSAVVEEIILRPQLGDL